MIKFDENVFKTALDTWGIDAQLGMTQEECAELIIEINKLFRGEKDCNLFEELADCLIMCNQLVFYYGDEPIQYHIDKKLSRLRLKLGKNNESQI